MNPASLREKLRYKFDNWMSRGVLALIGLLSVAALVAILFVSAVVALLRIQPEGEEIDFGEAVWLSLLRTLDGGTMGADRGPAFRAAMLIVTLIGLVVVAALISIIGSAFNARLEELRKGRSKVLEQGHTLILGWNSKIYQVIREVVIANESRVKPKIVIMADRDKVEMEDDLKTRIKHFGNTKVILRSGDPMSIADLRLTNFKKARSILILPPDEADYSDTVAIKTTMALLADASEEQGPSHIVTVLSDPGNIEVAKLIGGSRVTWIEADDLICRLIVQTSRQSGLSAVFTDLLDFEGSEMYLEPAGPLTGLSYEVAVSRLAVGCLMGIVRDKEVILNPNATFQIEAEDHLIIIAEDDASIRFSSEVSFNTAQFAKIENRRNDRENFVIMAPGRNARRIVSELAAYLSEGSTVTVVTEKNLELPDVIGVKIEALKADPTKKRTFDDLDLSRFQHAIVLADDTLGDVQRADAKTLHTLLHIREDVRLRNLKLNVVSEMLDDHNRELAEITQADDFIVSDKLVSYMMAQLEENDQLARVFNALFSPEGAEISLRPVDEYIALGEPVTFNTVVAAALKKGDSAIGHRVHVANGDWNLELAPDRAADRLYSEGDKIVVLTEK